LSEYIAIGCVKCLTCWDWQKGSTPDKKCPGCGAAASEFSFDEQRFKWTSVVRLLSDQESVQSFHGQREKEHEAGCRVCRGRKARELAPMLNGVMREQDTSAARRLIHDNRDAAPLAVSFTREEFRHMLESILRQEFGIETSPGPVEHSKKPGE